MSGKKLYITLSLIVLFAACMPLFTVNCIGGHDIIYHLLRIESLKEGILQGRPFLRINMLFFGGMGYASSLFYPDLLLYFPAALRALGAGIDLSYHLFIALCLILGFLSSFYCARRISGIDYAGLITAVIFTLYQYHIDDIYIRSAVGEFTAVIFVPFVIAGLYDFLFCEYKSPWLLFVGMTGVLLCHTITTVICAGLCLASVIADIRGLIKKPRKLLRLFLTAVLSLAVTSFYWLPVLEMFATGAFSHEAVFDVAYEAVKLWQIFDDGYNHMGIAVFLLLLPGLIIKSRDRFADMCAIAGIIITLCATSIFPWERLAGVLGFMQFPWRFFVVTGPLLAFAAGIYFLRLSEELDGGIAGDGLISRIMLLMVTAVMLVSAVSAIAGDSEEYYSYSDDYFAYIPHTADVIGGEWLPSAVEDRESLTEHTGEAVTDTGELIAILRNKNGLTVNDIPSGADHIDVPFIYYKGYTASDTETGESLPVTGDGANGRVRVHLSDNDSISVSYGGTPLQHIADVISMGSVGGIIIYMIINKRRKKEETSS